VANDPSYGRRDFFRDSVRSVAKAAQEYAQHRDGAAAQAPRPVRTDWLRPPGAVEDRRFLERCTRCGDCIKACPPGAILAHAGDGTPVIFADQSPCLLCDDFPCIAACATEALVPVKGIGDVRMGVAAVSHQLCTAGQGCHACVSKCPTNALALDLESLRLVVRADACVGCGMCETVCKAVNDHIAIRVTPARQRARVD
jgi:ferredoxin-type protein NapG